MTGNVAATTLSASANIAVGANVLLTTANLAIGNATANIYANSTAFVGNTIGVHTGNVVATTISGNLTGNVVATTISGNLTGNVAATTITGNLTGNVSATTISASANMAVGANVLLTTANLAIGNTTANVYVNSTAFVGNVVATSLSGNLTGNVVATTLSGNLTGNVVATTISGNLSGNVVATTVNASTINATSSIVVGSNVFINTSVISIGNTSVNVVANSTTFIGNVVATSLSGNLSGNVVATTLSGNLTGNVAATTLSGNLTAVTANVTGKLQIGTAAGFDFGSNAVIEADANGNTYVQFVLQNANTGNNASTDMVLTNDSGNDSVGYIDLGINGSNYDQPGLNIVGAGDGYLYIANGHLAIGTASDKDLIFHAGGTTSAERVLTVNSTAVTITNSIAFIANSSPGSAGEVLFSSATGVYWNSVSAVGGGSVNVAAQYAWTNTHSFAANVTLAGIIANGSIGTNNQVMKSNGTIAYWSNNSFKTLSDVPSVYTGNAGSFVVVNATEDGLTFSNNVTLSDIAFTSQAAPGTPSSDSMRMYMTSSGSSPNKEVAIKFKNELGEEIILSSILV